jgi:hypothetical protein
MTLRVLRRPTMAIIPSLVMFGILTLQSYCLYSSAFSISPPFVTSCRVQPFMLPLSAASSSNDEPEESQSSSSGNQMELPDYENEEILLKINLAMLPGVSTRDALQSVATYSQAFPFAAVLPVQPLTYLPTSDNGVEIKFLRKKTTEKSAVDGGIRFFIKEIQETAPVGDDAPTKESSSNDIVRAEEDEDEEDEEDCPMDSNGKCLELGGIEITAKRNSVGQTIRKITAERLVVTAYVAGITGEEREKYGSPPIDQVYVTSVFHKWM